MQRVSPSPLDVFSLAEIAAAAGVSLRDVRALQAAGLLPWHPQGFLPPAEAVEAVRMLHGRLGGSTVGSLSATLSERSGVGLAGSTAFHGAILGALVLWGALGGGAVAPAAAEKPQPVRLVFLSLPGPGGGGGGGGARQPRPATRAQLKARIPQKSPVVAAITQRQRGAVPEPKPVSRPESEPRPTVEQADTTPPVVAPVAPAAADPRTETGTVTAEPTPPPSQGAGQGGGAGTGEGTGLGEGTGAGIGPGSGGGTGGGPYRPGSGVTPPSLLHEVRPDYTEDARRRGVSGEVVLEIVVRSDGRVGSVRVIQGLGSGLDQRAVAAVRQWLFSPARRHGTPVDVLVEVAVEFRLR